MLSNYPPGVTGMEPQILGPDPAWEKLQEDVGDELESLFDGFGADVPAEIFDPVFVQIMDIIHDNQREV